MANLVPDNFQFRPPGARDVASWLVSFCQSMNAFVQQTVRALQDISSGAVVFRPLSIQTGTIAADSFPIIVPNPLQRAPRDVHIARALALSESAFLGPVVVRWMLTGDGNILVQEVTNLDADSTYDVILSVS